MINGIRAKAACSKSKSSQKDDAGVRTLAGLCDVVGRLGELRVAISTTLIAGSLQATSVY